VFRIYIDESGDHTYQQLDKQSARYLGLTGIILESGYYKNTLSPKLSELKEKFFPCDPDDPVILHREEIIRRDGVFRCLLDKECCLAWETAWLEFLAQSNFHIISVVIDKKYHQEQYRSAAEHPYHLALRFILERYSAFLKVSGAKGDVLAESRGGKEDTALKLAYRQVWNHGTYYRSKEFIQETLTSKKIKLKKKEHNIVGLQVADLLAYTCKRDILDDVGHVSYTSNPFSISIREVVCSKYNRWQRAGAVWGYGKKFFGGRHPQK